MLAPPAGLDPFAPALSNAELLRTERRMFQAQTWEVDLGKALDLRPGERLERRSGLFRLAGGGGLVRLDRVYRLGGVGPAVAATQTAPAPATPLAAAVDPTGPLDAGGGELVWANAMVADHLMVQVESGITRERLAASLPALARVGKPVTDGGLYLVTIPADGERSVERAVLALSQIKGVVKFAEPDFAMTSSDVTANDPLFTVNVGDLTKQWHLPKIRAPRAWNVLTGPPFSPAHPQYNMRLQQTVVAVVDTGIDSTHPDFTSQDLISRIWTNPGETNGGRETNGIDDDGNGKVDDWRGWDFIGQNPSANVIEPDNDPMDDVGHGTHVAGIIGGVGNNATGGSGVCWNVRLLNLRIIKAQGTGTIGYYSGAVAAMDYIRTLNNTGRKVAVANHSWGGSGYSLALLNALAPPVLVGGQERPKPYGCLHVAAAGNSRKNIDYQVPIYPACLRSGFVVSVGATDASDNIAVWQAGAGSNWGALNVDVFAPGSGIWSTYWKPAAATGPIGFVPVPGSPTQGYLALNGTSMAAPQVAAAIALMRLYQPAMSELQVRQLAIDQATVLPQLTGKCQAGGRLDVAKMIDRLYAPNLVADTGGGTGGAGDTAEALGGGQAVHGRILAGHEMWRIDQGKVVAWGRGHSALTELPFPSGMVMVAGSVNAAFALREDGTVWSMGNSVYSGGSTASFSQVPGLDGIVWISSTNGGFSTLALKSDGTVWAWGRNNNGELGDGTTTFRSTPIQIPGLSDIVQVEIGLGDIGSVSVALRSDGTVVHWGQIGTSASAFSQTTPVYVSGLTNIVSVAAGGRGKLAIRDDGTVWQWGGNIPTFLPNPIQVSGLQSVVQVAAGGYHFLAIDDIGRGFAWGDNGNGELGVATEIASAVPLAVQIPADFNLVAVAAGPSVSAALAADGRVLTWGNNYFGQLGNAVSTSSSLPVPILTPGPVTKVFGGVRGSYAVLQDGTLLRWGQVGPDYASQAPDGITKLQIPTVTTFIDQVAEMAVSGNHVVAIKSDRTVWSWGYDNRGSLGRGFDGYGGGSLGTWRTIGQVPGISGAVAIATKPDWGQNPGHTLVALSDGTLRTWGANDSGQLGDGSLSYKTTPVTVPGLSTVIQVAAGQGHSVALKSDGTVWSWGDNIWGQLGLGDKVDRSTPQQVTGISNVQFIDAGYDCTYCVKSDGTVWAWGRTPSSTPNEITLPTQIPGVANAVKIAVGAFGNIVVLQDGRLLSWGSNSARLGRTTDNPATPGYVVGLASVIQVEIGEDVHAITQGGQLYSWGYGSDGTLGNGQAWSNHPIEVVGFAGASDTLATLGTVDPTASWLLQNFSLNDLFDQNIVADTADPDGDRVSNLMEYALALNPRQNGAQGLPTSRVDLIGASAQSESAGQVQLFSLPTVDVTSGKRYQTLTVSRNGIRQDIDYIVEVSGDLLNWQSGDPFTITVLDTAETLEVYDATAMEDAPQRFMRLRIQRK